MVNECNEQRRFLCVFLSYRIVSTAQPIRYTNWTLNRPNTVGLAKQLILLVMSFMYEKRLRRLLGISNRVFRNPKISKPTWKSIFKFLVRDSGFFSGKSFFYFSTFYVYVVLFLPTKLKRRRGIISNVAKLKKKKPLYFCFKYRIYHIKRISLRHTKCNLSHTRIQLIEIRLQAVLPHLHRHVQIRHMRYMRTIQRGKSHSWELHLQCAH